MENEITAHDAGKVTELAVSRGRLGQRRRPDREDRMTPAAPDAALAALPWRGPRRAARTCRCRRTRCRSATAAAGASAGATSAPSPTSSCVCAARVHVGPLVQNFWAVVRPRERRDVGEHAAAAARRARRRLDRAPRRRGGRRRARRHGRLDYAPDEGSLVRIDCDVRGPDDARAFLGSASGKWAEAICPTSEEGQYVWTRKRADVPVECRRARSATGAGRSTRAGWRTSRPAITPATRSGAGRRASAARPTAARSAGTSSAGSTTRRSAPSARSGSTASRSEPGPVTLRRARRDRLRRRLAPRASPRSVERAKEENRVARQVQLPPAVRHLHRDAARRDRARARASA